MWQHTSIDVSDKFSFSFTAMFLSFLYLIRFLFLFDAKSIFLMEIATIFAGVARFDRTVPFLKDGGKAVHLKYFLTPLLIGILISHFFCNH
jgi:hypothetical protein